MISDQFMTTNSAPYIYDEVPYPNVSHSLSHPDRLATVATLLGMAPPEVKQCRVLELGCAAGGNLSPMAQGLPNSHFVGLDLSARQIDAGQSMITALGLRNISLKQTNILDVELSLGQFDYIIAHGVYSWVPAEVQDKVLDICRQHLSPNGVAYISYNTYPGWNMLGMLREMMLYHTQHSDNPHNRATESRALLDFLAESISTQSNKHSSFLHQYVTYVKDKFLPKDDSFLLHDELAEINEPLYFYQFAERASQYGLQYVGDVDFSSMLASNFPAEVTKNLQPLVKSTIELEQYLDFLRNRMFRQTLLCQKEVQLNVRFTPERLTNFYMASSAMPESTEPDIDTVAVEKFYAADGANLAIEHPLSKAAMLYLIEIWPRSAPFNEVLAQARIRLGRKGEVAQDSSQPNGVDEAQIVGATLLKAYGHSENLVEFHVYAPHFVLEISDYPVASPVARFQAQHQQAISNLRHERVTLDKVEVELLLLLNGCHHRNNLADILVEKDIVEVQRQDGQTVNNRGEIRRILGEMVEEKLKKLTQAALLIS